MWSFIINKAAVFNRFVLISLPAQDDLCLSLFVGILLAEVLWQEGWILYVVFVFVFFAVIQLETID